MQKKKFKEINVKDDFFTSLKNDYIEFEEWFLRKSEADCYVYEENDKLKGFLYLKEEDEPQQYKNKEGEIKFLQPPLLKIGTMKLDETISGHRLGEGMLRSALFHMRNSNIENLFVTVFSDKIELIKMFQEYGFTKIGTTLRDASLDGNKELVFLKQKTTQTTNTYPFVDLNAGTIKILPIEEHYHDKMFPDAKLANTTQNIGDLDVKNGIKKIYVCNFQNLNVNDIVFLYRKGTMYTGVITTLGLVTNVKNINNLSEEEYLKYVGNKTVFSQKEISNFYNTKRWPILIEIQDLGSFGSGNNVNRKWLLENNIWEKNIYPTDLNISSKDFIKVLNKAKWKNADTIVI